MIFLVDFVGLSGSDKLNVKIEVSSHLVMERDQKRVIVMGSKNTKLDNEEVEKLVDLLFETHGKAILTLAEANEHYFGYKAEVARRKASSQNLPVPVIRFPGQKSKHMIYISDLAVYLLETRESCKQEWAANQVSAEPKKKRRRRYSHAAPAEKKGNVVGFTK